MDHTQIVDRLKACEQVAYDKGYHNPHFELTLNYLDQKPVSVSAWVYAKPGYEDRIEIHPDSFLSGSVSGMECDELLSEVEAWIDALETADAAQRRAAIKAYSDAVAQIRALGIDLDTLQLEYVA